MPGKIKSKKQLKFLYAASEGKGISSGAGPSKEVAKKMLSHESHEKKSKLMRKGK